jgi:metallophosphoesterase (TIGR00282 family)
VRVVVIDFHAEATSEKIAFGWFMDGRVSAVMGTHTHVQTADERVLPGGTAYITDAGMTGPHDSVIGAEKEVAIQRFINQLPARFEPAIGDVKLCGALLDVDEETGRARQIDRLRIDWEEA